MAQLALHTAVGNSQQQSMISRHHAGMQWAAEAGEKLRLHGTCEMGGRRGR